jgi:hypothetical protein
VSGGNHPDDRVAEALERQEEARQFERMHVQMFGRIGKAPPAGREEAPAPAGSGSARPWRHLPDQLPLEKVEHLDTLLDERKEAGKPRRGPHTLPSITRQVGGDFNIDRVRQGEQLREQGWDLRRTHPAYPVDDGFVRWPQPLQVPDLLG